MTDGGEPNKKGFPVFAGGVLVVGVLLFINEYFHLNIPLIPVILILLGVGGLISFYTKR